MLGASRSPVGHHVRFDVLASGCSCSRCSRRPPRAARPSTRSPSRQMAISRVGDYVERYYARAQSIVVDENVAIQPLGPDLRNDGFARRLTYELRVEWNPDAGRTMTAPRRSRGNCLPINGRPPKPGQEPECLDPRSTSPEPLAFLLPERRREVRFQGRRPRSCRRP